MSKFDFNLKHTCCQYNYTYYFLYIKFNIFCNLIAVFFNCVTNSIAEYIVLNFHFIKTYYIYKNIHIQLIFLHNTDILINTSFYLFYFNQLIFDNYFHFLIKLAL